MRMSSIKVFPNDLPQSHQGIFDSSSDKSCKRRSTMSPASSKNSSQFLEITMAQDWLKDVKEEEAKIHAQMMLSDIVSRYRKTSETVYNYAYYMDLLDLSRDHLQCLEDSDILTRFSFCNFMTEEGGTFEVLTLSNELRDLIQTQRLKNTSQGET